MQMVISIKRRFYGIAVVQTIIPMQLIRLTFLYGVYRYSFLVPDKVFSMRRKIRGSPI
jgi:hypothetical protein